MLIYLFICSLLLLLLFSSSSCGSYWGHFFGKETGIAQAHAHAYTGSIHSNNNLLFVLPQRRKKRCAPLNGEKQTTKLRKIWNFCFAAFFLLFFGCNFYWHSFRPVDGELLFYYSVGILFTRLEKSTHKDSVGGMAIYEYDVFFYYYLHWNISYVNFMWYECVCMCVWVCRVMFLCASNEFK